MTEREINEKAREIYIRCFDDVGEYVGVINALVIAVRETSRELEAQIEKMKCCGNCAKNGHICVAEEMQGKLCGKNKDKWELRR